MMLAAFRVRSFRFQWPADLLTSWAFEMETLILSWYVMVNTGSVLWLTAFGSLQYIGTLAAAGLSTVLGVGYAFVFVTLFYVASLALTLGVARGSAVPDPAAVRASVLMSRPSRYRDLKDGLVHVATTPMLLAVMVLAFLINLCAYPVTSGLLPYVAERVFFVGASGLGWLVASFSLGALRGWIAIVVTCGRRRPERSMLVHAALWYVLLFAFGHVRSMSAGLVLLLLAGFVQSVAMISLMGSLLAAADSRFRTRVMGVRTLAVYGLPLGLMGAGALIERVGYSLTVSVCCAVGLVSTLLIGIRW